MCELDPITPQEKAYLPLDQKLACPDCDLLIEVPAVAVDACCPRCGARILRKKYLSDLRQLLAWLGVTLIAFIVANGFPIVTLSVLGVPNTATLWQTFWALYQGNRLFVALLVLLTGIVLPFLQLLSQCYIVWSLYRGKAPRAFPWVMRFNHLMMPWCMVEVFLLGVLVALVKLSGTASVQVMIGPGLLGLFALVFLTANNSRFFDESSLWRMYQACRLTV